MLCYSNRLSHVEDGVMTQNIPRYQQNSYLAMLFMKNLFQWKEEFLFMKISQAISRTTRPNRVICTSMNFPCRFWVLAQITETMTLKITLKSPTTLKHHWNVNKKKSWCNKKKSWCIIFCQSHWNISAIVILEY